MQKFLFKLNKIKLIQSMFNVAIIVEQSKHIK